MTDETPAPIDEPADVAPVDADPAPDVPPDPPADPPSEDPADPEPADPDPSDPPAEAKALAAARREAAGYRTRLRAAEGEVETLRAEVETHRRRQIDGVLTGTAGELHDPGDVWQFTGLTTADLFDDEGALDEARLTSALSELRQARPYLFRHSVNAGPRDGGARGSSGPTPSTDDVMSTMRRAAGGY